MPEHCKDCPLFGTSKCPLLGKVDEWSDVCGPYHMYASERTAHTISLNSIAAKISERNKERPRHEREDYA